MSLEKILEYSEKGPGVSAKPLLCIEVNPPRGVEFQGVIERLEGQLDGIDFLNVTDSALARMRMAPLPFASFLKHRLGVEPLVNYACRDRNLIAMQGDLLAGWALGIRSVVALTGDAVTIGDSPDRKGVFEVNSIGLLNTIVKLNSGSDLAGHELQGAPQFVPGVVVNPNVKNGAAEIRRLEKKKAAGARYALSQPVFDEESSYEFFKMAKPTGIPIFMGLLAFRSAKAARNVVNVPGIRLSPQIQLKIDQCIEQGGEEDLSEFFIEHALKLAAKNRDVVAGFHVISGVTPKLGLKLARRLAEWVRSL